jgi:hypothetical protein
MLRVRLGGDKVKSQEITDKPRVGFRLIAYNGVSSRWWCSQVCVPNGINPELVALKEYENHFCVSCQKLFPED